MNGYRSPLMVGSKNDSTWPGNPNKTHQKGGTEGITQARGRVQVGTVCHNTNSKVGGLIAIHSIEFQVRYNHSTKYQVVWWRSRYQVMKNKDRWGGIWSEGADRVKNKWNTMILQVWTRCERLGMRFNEYQVITTITKEDEDRDLDSRWTHLNQLIMQT